MDATTHTRSASSARWRMNAGATTANVVATPHASDVAHKAANTAVLKSQEIVIERAQLTFPLNGSLDERDTTRRRQTSA